MDIFRYIYQVMKETGIADPLIQTINEDGFEVYRLLRYVK